MINLIFLVSQFKKNCQKKNTNSIDDSKLINSKVEQESSIETKKSKLLEEQAIKNLEIFQNCGLDNNINDTRLAIVNHFF